MWGMNRVLFPYSYMRGFRAQLLKYQLLVAPFLVRRWNTPSPAFAPPVGVLSLDRATTAGSSRPPKAMVILSPSFHSSHSSRIPCRFLSCCQRASLFGEI